MYYFIVNTYSGKNRIRDFWHEISLHLKKREVPFKAYQTTKSGDAIKIARNICAQEDDDIRIIVVGGDGTINETLNGISDFDKVKFGVLPLGSANDFLRGASVKESPISALDKILAVEETTNIDIGRLVYPDGATRLFGISAGVGLDAAVCKLAQTSDLKRKLNRIGMGKYTYIIHTLQSFMQAKGVKATIVIDDEETFDFDDTIFIAGMNMPAEGGGVAMCPDASYTDGKLSMCLAYNVNGIKKVVGLGSLALSKHVGSSYFAHRDFEKLHICFESPMCLHTDGEYLGEVTEVTMEVLKGRLRLLSI